MLGPNSRRATAIVQSCSSRAGSGAPAILVPGLALKFWMMSSCRWPYVSWTARSASSDSMRSRRVSPMPISRPVLARLDALAARFANADQQTGGHRNAQITGGLEGREALRRHLIGGTEVRTTAFAQAVR